jgi:hypothetical protein
MASHKLLVFSNPTEGKEDEFNKWYDEIHLGEVLEVPGIVRAQRFSVADVLPGVTDHKYVAVYDLDTDDPGGVLQALGAAVPNMNMSDAFDAETAKMTMVSALGDEQQAS